MATMRELGWLALASISLLCCTSSTAQTPVFTFIQTGVPDWSVGFSVAGTGDMDGDGWPDVVAGSHGITEGFFAPGRVVAFSGRDGHVLHTFDKDTTPATWSYIGVNGLGDVDGDGRGDFGFNGSPGYEVISGAHGTLIHSLPAVLADAMGRVNADAYDDIVDFEGDLMIHIISGLDATTLLAFPVFTPGALWPQLAGLIRAGDTDADGAQDVATLVLEFESAGGTTFQQVQYLRVFSGRTGALLFQPDLAAIPAIVVSLLAFGDLDQDGHDDLVLNTIADAGGPQAMVLSGFDASILRTYADPQLGNTPNALALCAPGDLDRDGTGELIVSRSPGAGGSPGRATIFSGATGTIFASLQAPDAGFGFGYAMAALGDVTGDGAPDFAISTEDYEGGHGVHVFSGRDVPVADLAGGVHGMPYPFDVAPVLSAHGSYKPDSAVTLTLANEPASVPLALIIGTQWQPIGLGGMAPSPDVVVPLAAGSDGIASLTFRWPPVGTGNPPELFVQAFGPTPLRRSNALHVHLP